MRFARNIALLTATLALFGCNDGGNATATPISTSGTNTSTGSTIRVSMKTSMGDMELELYPDKAPVTVANFMQYANSGFYNNLIFHRVVKDYVIQGGGISATGQTPATRAPIKLEVGNGLSNLRGSIAMARTLGLDSATSQFFINTNDNVKLDSQSGGYAVFGKVVSGLSVVDQINLIPTDSSDQPLTQVVIKSVSEIK